MSHNSRRKGVSLPALILTAVLALGLIVLIAVRFSASRRVEAAEVSAYLAPTPDAQAVSFPAVLPTADPVGEATVTEPMEPTPEPAPNRFAQAMAEAKAVTAEHFSNQE